MQFEGLIKKYVKYFTQNFIKPSKRSMPFSFKFKKNY